MSGGGPLEDSLPGISAADLRARMESGVGGFFILDTRSRKEFEEAHLPGSLHCPVHELARRAGELPPRGATLVVVGEPGKRGIAGAIFLALAGFGSLALLEGGFPAWGGPVESGPPER